jgi:hypothetical protein
MDAAFSRLTVLVTTAPTLSGGPADAGGSGVASGETIANGTTLSSPSKGCGVGNGEERASSMDSRVVEDDPTESTEVGTLDASRARVMNETTPLFTRVERVNTVGLLSPSIKAKAVRLPLPVLYAPASSRQAEVKRVDSMCIMCIILL